MIASVRPEGAEHQLGEYEHAIWSLAPGQPEAAGKELDGVRAWMAARLRQGVVLLADTLEVTHRQIALGCSEARALADVEGAIRTFMEGEAQGFAGPGCRFQFTRTSSLLEQAICDPFREMVRQSSLGGGRPGEGLFEHAGAWVAATPSMGKGHLSAGLLRQMALEAILDHLAVLALLRSQGWNLHIHQGLSSVLRWLNGDQIFDPPLGLRRMVFVELGPRIWP